MHDKFRWNTTQPGFFFISLLDIIGQKKQKENTDTEIAEAVQINLDKRVPI